MSVDIFVMSFSWTDIEIIDCVLRSGFVEHYLSKQVEKHLFSQPIVCGRRMVGRMVTIEVFEIRAVKHALLSAVEVLDTR
jgi:hypothetical protein